MPDFIPTPLQAILWPLAGAAIILALGRILPNWTRRLAAAAAALAALWSLRAGGLERVSVFWEPLNFFRMGPVLHADSLALLVGLALTGTLAAALLGIRGSEPRTRAEGGARRAAWHGLVLAALAGCLLTTMAANLLTLALGSGLIDLALIALALLAVNGQAPSTRRLRLGPVLGMAVLGVASTLLLLLSALQMDTQMGHASLLARNLPTGVLLLVGLAGVLRLLPFPLHPRRLNTPESAVILILSVGVGVYLLARAQTLAPAADPVMGSVAFGSTGLARLLGVADQPALLVAGGMSLLAGGLLSWSGGFWPGLAAYQSGYALIFALLLGGATPWPLMGLALALALLAVWWDSCLEREAAPRPRWLAWIGRQLAPWWTRAGAYLTRRAPVLARRRDSWLARQGGSLLPALALASLAGAPFTVGARGRWPLYASLLRNGDASLFIVLAADTFLAAGLWTAFSAALKQSGERRIPLAALLAMIALAVPMIVLGVAPGELASNLGLEPITVPHVSVWGAGLLYPLPWLLGAWLARVSASQERYLDLVRRIVNLGWLYRAAAGVGRRLVGAVYWLGRVGEGEGWWGWALIILALGAIFLTIR